MHAGEDRDPGEPEQDPDEAQPSRALAGTNQTARSARKIGTDEFATAATPESTYFSPQAMSVNGIAAFRTPSTSPGRHAAPIARQPYREAAKTSSTGAAHASRISISAAGDRSRTPTLMKRYDEPQIAPEHEEQEEIPAAHTSEASARRAEAQTAGAERDAGEDQRKPADRGGAEALAEEDRAVGSAIGGTRYVTSDAYAAPAPAMIA